MHRPSAGGSQRGRSLLANEPRKKTKKKQVSVTHRHGEPQYPISFCFVFVFFIVVFISNQCHHKTTSMSSESLNYPCALFGRDGLPCDGRAGVWVRWSTPQFHLPQGSDRLRNHMLQRCFTFTGLLWCHDLTGQSRILGQKRWFSFHIYIKKNSILFGYLLIICIYLLHVCLLSGCRGHERLLSFKPTLPSMVNSQCVAL